MNIPEFFTLVSIGFLLGLSGGLGAFAAYEIAQFMRKF